MAASARYTIPITVSPESAEYFRSLPLERQSLVKAVLERAFEQAINPEGESLRELLARARKQAKERGLTPEILNQILDEE